jgi:uncharacterized membrane protein YfcA
MDPGPLRDALTLVAGVATGILSAAFGVGGATISTPAIRLLGAPALVAVGTTLPSILPSAITGTARYAREHIIQWHIVAWTGSVGMVASVGGSLLSNVVPGNGHLLMLLTAAILGFTSWRMARSMAEVPADVVHDAGSLGASGTDEATARIFRPNRNDRPLVLMGIAAGPARHHHPRLPGRHRLALRVAARRRRHPRSTARRGHRHPGRPAQPAAVGGHLPRRGQRALLRR